MRLRAVLRVMRMEVGQLNLLNLLILVGSTILMFYPLITDGFIDMGDRAGLESLAKLIIYDKPEYEVIIDINRIAYLEKKVYMLIDNGLFNFAYISILSFTTSIEPLFLMLGVAAYISMEASSMLRSGVFKRYMTLPITREEYIFGKILFNIIVVAYSVVTTYFLVGTIFYRPDITLLLASLISLPELLLMSSIAFSISLVVRREMMAFILSSGGLYIIFTQLVLGLNRWLSSENGPPNNDPVVSPMYGYIVSLGILDEIETGDVIGDLIRGRLGISPHVDLQASFVVFTIYIIVVIAVSLLIVLLTAYFLRRVEVD